MALEDQVPTRGFGGRTGGQFASPSSGLNLSIASGGNNGDLWGNVQREAKLIGDTLFGLQVQQQQMYAETRAQDLINQVRKDFQDEFNQLSSLQGLDAIERRKTMDDRLNKIRNHYLQVAAKDEPVVNRLFEQASERAMFETQSRADAYTMEQTVKYNQDTNKAMLSLAAQELATNYNTALYDQSKTEFDAALGKMLDESGLVPNTPAWDDARRKAYDEVHGQAIGFLIDMKNFGSARKALTQHKSEMDFATWGSLWAQLRNAQEAEYKSALAEKQAALNAQIKDLENKFYKLKEQGDGEGAQKVYDELKQLVPLDEIDTRIYQNALDDVIIGKPETVIGKAIDIGKDTGNFLFSSQLINLASIQNRTPKLKLASMKGEVALAERNYEEEQHKAKAKTIKDRANSLMDIGSFADAFKELQDGKNNSNLSSDEYFVEINNFVKRSKEHVEKKGEDAVEIIKSLLDRGAYGEAGAFYAETERYLNPVQRQKIETEAQKYNEQIRKAQKEDGITLAKSYVGLNNFKKARQTINSLYEQALINNYEYQTQLNDIDASEMDYADELAETRAVRGMTHLEEQQALTTATQDFIHQEISDFQQMNGRVPNAQEKQSIEVRAQAKAAQTVEQLKEKNRQNTNAREARKQGLITQAYMELKEHGVDPSVEPIYQLSPHLQAEINKDTDKDDIITKVNNALSDTVYNPTLSRIIDDMPRTQIAQMTDTELFGLKERYGGNAKNMDEMLQKRQNAQHLTISDLTGITDRTIKDQLIEQYELEDDDLSNNAYKSNQASIIASSIFNQAIKAATDPATHNIDNNKFVQAVNNLIVSADTQRQLGEDAISRKIKERDEQFEVQSQIPSELTPVQEQAIFKWAQGSPRYKGMSREEILQEYMSGRMGFILTVE